MMVRVARSAGCSVHPSPVGADGSKTRAPLLWYCSTTGSEKPSVSTVHTGTDSDAAPVRRAGRGIWHSTAARDSGAGGSRSVRTGETTSCPGRTTGHHAAAAPTVAAASARLTPEARSPRRKTTQQHFRPITLPGLCAPSSPKYTTTIRGVQQFMF